MSLKARIALAMGCIAAAVGVLAGAGAFVAASNELSSAADEFLTTRAMAISDSMEQFSTDSPLRPQAPRGAGPVITRNIDRALLTPDAITQIINAEGELQFSIDGEATLPITDVDQAIAMGDSGARITTLTVDGDDYRMITSPVQGGGAVQVARLTNEDAETLSGLRRQLFFYVILGSIAAAAIGYFFARRATRPIESLAASTRDIAATGALRDVPTGDSTDREVADLSNSFNQMVHALAASKSQQQQLVMDASHELRTPLTSLRGGIELLALGDRLDEADRAQLLANLQSESIELQMLVEELVDLATDRYRDEEPTTFDLAEVARQVADRATARYGFDVTVNTQNSATVTLNRGAVERALQNLVDNAAKHGKPPVEITVDGGSVSVRDHGDGIDPADLDRVFDRFWRADSARSRPGSGLGLSIVHRNVTDSRGTVSAENHPDGGAVLSCRFSDDSADS